MYSFSTFMSLLADRPLDKPASSLGDTTCFYRTAALLCMKSPWEGATDRLSLARDTVKGNNENLTHASKGQLLTSRTRGMVTCLLTSAPLRRLPRVGLAAASKEL